MAEDMEAGTAEADIPALGTLAEDTDMLVMVVGMLGEAMLEGLTSEERDTAAVILLAVERTSAVVIRESFAGLSVMGQ